jgi:hypothetical protein
MTRPTAAIHKLALTLCLASFCSLGQASEQTLVYPSIPGTSTPDRSATPYVVEGDQVYKAIPGTRTPDRSGDSWTIRQGEVRPNIPGTRTPKAP